MPLLVVLIFIAMFAVIAPVLIFWSGAGKAGPNKQVIAALNTGLGAHRKQKGAPILDFRKIEIFSSIPWLHHLLAKFDLIPRLQKILNQAEVKWTPGTLLLMSMVCFAGSSYLIDLRTGSIILGLLVGAVLGFIPVCYVLLKRG